MSDVLRLKKELETLYYAILADLEDERADLDRRGRQEEARNRLLEIVDEAVQDVTRPTL